MMRTPRSVHRMLWIVIALALALGVSVALVSRAPAHAGARANAKQGQPMSAGLSFRTMEERDRFYSTPTSTRADLAWRKEAAVA